MVEPKGAVLVTGAAGGIGRAVVERLRRDGYWVLGADLALRNVTAVACDEFVEVDLSQVVDPAMFEHDIIGRLRGHLGNRDLRGLVHAAALQLVGTLDTFTVSDLQRIFVVNVLAPFALTQALRDDLRRARGSVVHIGSVHTKLSKKGFSLYSTSKAALSGLTRALALELAPEVRVNEVSPAATDTPMLRAGFGEDWGPQVEAGLSASHPLQRIATADEVAAAVAFLISPDSSFVTGAALEVGGGVHVRLHDVF